VLVCATASTCRNTRICLYYHVLLYVLLLTKPEVLVVARAVCIHLLVCYHNFTMPVVRAKFCLLGSCFSIFWLLWVWLLIDWKNPSARYNVCNFASVLRHCWFGDRKGIRPVKKIGCWFVGGDDLTGALHVL